MSPQGISETYIQPLSRFLIQPEAAETLQQVLVEAEWDQDLDEGLRDALARIRLFVSEAFQGLRPPEDVRVEITRLLYSLAAEQAYGSVTTQAEAEFPDGLTMSRLVYCWDSTDWSSTQADLGPTSTPREHLVMDVRNAQSLPGAGLDEVQLITEPVPA